MKKLYILSVVLLLFLNVLSGCTSAGNNTEKAAEGTGDSNVNSSNEEVVLKFWTGNDLYNGEESPGMVTINEFNEEYKGKIRLETTFMPWSEHNTAIQAALSTDDLPDLFAMPQGSELNRLVSQNLIRPIDDIVSDEWKSQFYEGSFMEGVNVLNGNTYTWPFTGPAMNNIMYYNKTVLENAGLDPESPPKTWDEFREMSRIVTEKGQGDVYGVVFAGGANGWTKRMMEGFAIGVNPTEGINGFNYKQGKYTLDSQAWKDTMNLFLDLKKDNSILPSAYSLPQMDASVLFGTDKAAFFFEARWGLWLLKRDTPDANFGLAAIPTPDGSTPQIAYNLAPTTGIVVSNSTEHPKEVGTVIERALASENFYTKYMEGGVALAPFEQLNQDEANYPFPEFKKFVQLHEQVLRQGPDPSIRNPEVAQVIEEMAGMQQSTIKPSIDELLISILVDSGENADERLNSYAEKLNTGLDDAINKVHETQADITHDTFTFPNWDPSKNYTQTDYLELD
jgi:multiple sugar transport system substrate-binding protein